MPRNPQGVNGSVGTDKSASNASKYSLDRLSGNSVGAYVYIVKYRDEHFYVGSTRGNLQQRIAEHNDGTHGGYTRSRRPVELMFFQEFDRLTDAVAAERQIKGWSRAKKKALICGDMAALRRLSRNRREYPHPSTSSG